MLSSRCSGVDAVRYQLVGTCHRAVRAIQRPCAPITVYFFPTGDFCLGSMDSSPGRRTEHRDHLRHRTLRQIIGDPFARWGKQGFGAKRRHTARATEHQGRIRASRHFDRSLVQISLTIFPKWSISHPSARGIRSSCCRITALAPVSDPSPVRYFRQSYHAPGYPFRRTGIWPPCIGEFQQEITTVRLYFVCY